VQPEKNETATRHAVAASVQRLKMFLAMVNVP